MNEQISHWVQGAGVALRGAKYDLCGQSRLFAIMAGALGQNKHA
jgi:hypothetical protein